MSRGKRYTAEQIIKILREVEIYTARGQTVEQAVRACGITEKPIIVRAKNTAASRIAYSGHREGPSP